MAPASRSTLQLLRDNAAAEGETAQQHIRNAIQSLILAEERATQLVVGGDPTLAELLRSAEHRCFRALFDLGEEVHHG